MNISDLLCMVENYAIEDYWSAAAIVTLKKKLDHAILKLIGEILKMPGGSSTIKIKRWKENNAKSIEKWHFLLGDSKAKFATNTSQLATLSVVVDMLKKLLRSKRH
jgi:NAD-specific glutamate dehydrogenase